MLQKHEDWPKVKPRLDEVLEMFGPGNRAGCREDNCIHVCFSKMGLINRCNHYMKQGAEVDGHIVHHLFGNNFAALKLLEKGRKPYLVSFTPTFEEAVMAANPWAVR